MSDARWCNYGNHTFDGAREDTVFVGRLQPRSPGVTAGGYDHGVPRSPDLKEICGDCAAAMGVNDAYEAPKSPKERKTELLKELETLKDA